MNEATASSTYFVVVAPTRPGTLAGEVGIIEGVRFVLSPGLYNAPRRGKGDKARARKQARGRGLLG